MFLKTLRQLTVMEVGNEIELSYLCKFCNKRRYIRIDKEQYDDLRKSIPFSSVFKQPFTQSIQNLRKGSCNNHERID